jgi:hypothetical protein
VRLPADLLGGNCPTHETSIGMSWHDAKHAAVVIVFDATSRDDGAGFLRLRAS